MSQTRKTPIAPVYYTIRPARPHAHCFLVSCEVERPDPSGQVFRLPAWIPGSYMIREFARNIVTLRAESGGGAVAIEKLDKHTWRAAPVPAGAKLRLEYEVYAWDLSVRTAHLDATHGFFNGTSVFLAVAGREHQPCTVDILAPDAAAVPQLADWRVATTLPRAPGSRRNKPDAGFGRYRADDYDELVDHPVEMGNFTLAHFEACGVRHEIALTGRHDCDLERLCADLQRICEWQIRFFGEPAPMERYLFLVMVVGDGYGGLEHRASTALICSRGDLPQKGMQGLPDAYKTFLGLCSHEYFHTWNVKRIKPAAFMPYALERENYTRLLWVFEGFTSYYDDLVLRRAGVIGDEDYLELVAKNLSGVLRGSGRKKQSVAESSFDAWIKYYRQDENAPNAIVSYYAKGALIALALDLRLRALGDGGCSLDALMQVLWQRFGQRGVGVGEDEIYTLVHELVEAHAPGKGHGLAQWLRRSVEGTEDLPLEKLLRTVGVSLHFEVTSRTPTLGIKLAGGNGEAKIAQVFDDGPAQRAGLSAGDVLVALDGLKVSSAGLDAMLARRAPGEHVEVHVFRRDELLCLHVVLAAAPEDKANLRVSPRAGREVVARRRAWLGAV